MKPLILVFDDDLVNHRGFLAELPARFVYRGNADRVLEDVALVKPRCVFMDHSMGGKLNGVDAVRLLRQRHDHDALIIVAISSDTRMNQRMCRVGATEGIAKMALPDRFHSLVEPLLG